MVLYSCMPVGSNFGWGVLGKYVTLELAQLTETRLILQSNQKQDIGDEIDAARLRVLLLRPQEMQQFVGNRWALTDPVIQVASGADLFPLMENVDSRKTVGFAVFEEETLLPQGIDRAKNFYSHLAAGSTYCADILKSHGVTNVSVALHGVDTSIFHPPGTSFPREIFRDKFVVFSGGKFELRKGQDIAIRAYKVLQDRHKDVALINCWFNYWNQSRDTMAASTLIRYSPPDKPDHDAWVRSLLAANGIDTSRVLPVAIRDNRLLPRIYHHTDVGLFPNRVEGGTNMLLMEYMACGKPAIASFNSGHKDILTPQNSIPITTQRATSSSVPIPQGFPRSEPDLDESVAHLEWAYQNRDKLSAIGARAATDMQSFTWKRVAEKLLAAAQSIGA